MARKAEVTGEVSTEVGGAFKPLPAGRYEVTIFGVEEGKYKNGPNKGRPNINVQYRISEGQKGTNRRIFDLIPLFTNWAGPDAKDAFSFFQFFSTVQGMSEKDFRIAVKEDGAADDLPDDDDLLGMELTITLKVEDDDYHFEEAKKKWESEGSKGDAPVQADYQRNRVAGISPAGNGNMDRDSDDEPSSGGGSTKRSKATVLDL